MTVDFEREGLLEGLDGDARAARIELLERLSADGVPVEELRSAVAEDRLALVPVEHALAGEGRYTVAELAKRTGLDEDFLLAQRQAFGMPRPAADERILTDDDLEAARRVKEFRDAGLPDDGILEAARVMGQAMANVAAASRQLVGEAMMSPGDTELDLGTRYLEAAGRLGPLMGPLLEHGYAMHVREGMRRDAVGRAEREAGRLPGGAEVSIAFADLVGFTRLGEKLPAADLGRVAGRLAALASDVSEPPVRLVKTIGDAAMLVSAEAEPLVAAALDVVAAADEEGEEFPQLRAGLARGAALNRGGDWYGSPVNLASRVTAAARPGSVLTTREVRDAAGDGYRWSRAPARHFKGIEGRVRLYRARRLEPGHETGDERGEDGGRSDERGEDGGR
jgi:adenylate cyclase